MVLPPKNVEAWNEDWAWSEVYTYVLLDNETTPSVLEPSLRKIVKQFHSDDKGDKYLLEPLRDIRLSAMDGSGRATYIYFFRGILVTSNLYEAISPEPKKIKDNLYNL